MSVTKTNPLGETTPNCTSSKKIQENRKNATDETEGLFFTMPFPSWRILRSTIPDM